MQTSCCIEQLHCPVHFFTEILSQQITIWLFTRLSSKFFVSLQKCVRKHQWWLKVVLPIHICVAVSRSDITCSICNMCNKRLSRDVKWVALKTSAPAVLKRFCPSESGSWLRISAFDEITTSRRSEALSLSFHREVKLSPTSQGNGLEVTTDANHDTEKKKYNSYLPL